MQADQLKQSINRIEECVDEAKRAVQNSSSPELKQCVDSLHQQARQVQQQADSQQQQGQGSQSQGGQSQGGQIQGGQSQGGQRQGGQNQAGQGQDGLRQAVMQLEQTADRAKQACRSGNADPQAQQAVQRAHDEISNLKKQIQMS
jgi:hypothetical protein